MNWTLILEPPAGRDAQTGLAFYASRDPKLADRLTRKLGKILKEIRKNPYRWAEVEDGIREAIVDGWPYAIYYRLSEGSIHVFAIFHTSCDPQEWMDRI